MPPEYRVLLAEDNPVNQEVGRAMLETLGCRVDVADNGLEAFRMVVSNSYSIVFMDCQMPRMDGLEATAKIRDAESSQSRRTPVIALTAYVMDDEIQECRAAGMDDYLGKPFSLNDLSEVLKRWADKNGAGNGTSHTAHGGTHSPDLTRTSPNSPPGPIDNPHDAVYLDPGALDNLRATFGQRAQDMINMVVSIYLKDSPALIVELSASLLSGDREALHRAVHTLKSSSANLGAYSLAESCKKFENRIKEGALTNCESMIESIKAQHHQVLRALQHIIDRGN